MRFDGHVMITENALSILADLSKRKDLLWAPPKRKLPDESTAEGHKRGVWEYFNSSEARLPDLVAGVSDISNAQSHILPDLQRLHFMRATEETELVAHRNGIRLIIDEMEAWIAAQTEGFWQQAGRLARRAGARSLPRALGSAVGTVLGGPVGGLVGDFAGDKAGIAAEKGQLVDAHLAKALHCLQDSFAPGHVLRSQTDGNQSLGSAKSKIPPACFASAPPIRRIFDYNHPHDDENIEAKHRHDDDDYYAGSLGSAAANAASYASANLLQIGLDSIANQRTDPGAWTTFISRWLVSRSLDAGSGKPKFAADSDLKLQRTCSPLKMVCGQCPAE